MAINDYNSLVTAVGSWLHRTDLATNIPDFIQLAEVRLSRDLRVWPLVTTTTVVFTGSLTTTTALPANYLEVVKAVRGDGVEMQYVPYDTVQRVSRLAVSTPWVYACQSNNLIVAPASSVTATVILSYYKKETPLSGTNTTNWYITNAADLLLYASLLEAESFMIDDARLPVWLNFYSQGTNAVNKQFGYKPMPAIIPPK